MNQNELLIKALFDPRIDDVLDVLRQDDEFVGLSHVTKEPNLDKSSTWTDDVVEVNDVYGMEQGEGPYIGDRDYSLLPDLLDDNYEQIWDFHRESDVILENFAHDRVDVVRWWNTYTDHIYNVLAPLYVELDEMKIKWLSAVVSKYDRLIVYKYLRDKSYKELLQYKRMYIVGNGITRRVFLELYPTEYMSKEEVKRSVQQIVDRSKANSLPNDIDRGWLFWQKKRAGMTHFQIIDELDDEHFQDTKQVSRVLKRYTSLYPDFFKNNEL